MRLKFNAYIQCEMEFEGSFGRKETVINFVDRQRCLKILVSFKQAKVEV